MMKNSKVIKINSCGERLSNLFVITVPKPKALNPPKRSNRPQFVTKFEPELPFVVQPLMKVEFNLGE